MLTVRFYAELNDYLPPPERFRDAALTVTHARTVEEVIAQLGVPLAAVDLILVNGRSVPPHHLAGEGDRVSVYPVFESFDIRPVQRLRAEPLRTPRFVLDVHLGRLSKLLRLLGIDAVYMRRASDDELVAVSRAEQRVLLSRDRALIARRDLERAHLVRHQHPDEQLSELIERFQLSACIRPFSRCLLCNTPLQEATTEDTSGLVPARVSQMYREFWRCPSCGRIFWRGSHYERMRAKLLHLIEKT